MMNTQLSNNKPSNPSDTNKNNNNDNTSSCVGEDGSTSTKRKREAMPNESKSNKSKSKSRSNAMAITPDGEMPQKRFYRSRAHCNPLSHNDTFNYPSRPDIFDWTVDHYPNFSLVVGGDNGGDSGQDDNADAKEGTKKEESPSSLLAVPTILDIGCGFGGLTTALATILPNKLILGLEIRAKVTEYVRLRILALRKEHPGQYENCSVLRSNTMKLMPHFFRPKSLEKIFFCFPDPHFKKKNHSRRIVAERLLTEYAYFLKDGGRLYTITDVEDLHNWHVSHCRAHPMFRELNGDELEDDPCVKAMYSETEEGKKVERAGTKKYYAVYEKLEFDKVKESTKITAENFFDGDQFGVLKRE